MELQAIYSFLKRNQVVLNLDIDEQILQNKYFLKRYLEESITKEEKKELFKISCCVITDEEIKLPEWYLICNGKFFYYDKI